MRRLLLGITLGVAQLVCAKVVYLPIDGGKIPADAAVVAAEARAALPEGKIGTNKQASWAIVLDTDTIRLTFNNIAFVDGIDQAKASISGPRFNVTVEEQLDYSGGPNTLAIEWSEQGVASIYAGRDRLKLVAHTTEICPPTDSIKVISTCNIDVIDLLIESNPDNFSRLATSYTPEEIEDATIWRYLDRQNDPSTALPGGSYVLAALPTPSGFDLLYVDGAVTNASHWTLGMQKGRLVKTGFKGYYKLEWVDATGRKLPGEHFAELTDNVLVLNFPALQTILRFSR